MYIKECWPSTQQPVLVNWPHCPPPHSVVCCCFVAFWLALLFAALALWVAETTSAAAVLAASAAAGLISNARTSYRTRRLTWSCCIEGQGGNAATTSFLLASLSASLFGSLMLLRLPLLPRTPRQESSLPALLTLLRELWTCINARLG